ncbi:MAG TPA: hypothetical protein VGX69_07890 [Solirubrobacteraceae bacterium]|nr:hypothetical protein [Solirubrobacteraceae bacterium]
MRAIDRVRTRLYLQRIRRPTAEYVQRYGFTVRAGPFAGLRYPAELRSAPGDLVAKLLGSYERELHGVLEEWVAAGHANVIDVGCAEGYYAVGFALKMAQTTVHAFDIDPLARERCGALARLNDVVGRVRLDGICEPASLEAFPERGVALLADCEGYERVLLDPRAAPKLRGWPILVELHEFLDERITQTIEERFRDTHTVALLGGEDRADDGLDELASTSARTRAALLGERRPGRMRWGHLRPR